MWATEVSTPSAGEGRREIVAQAPQTRRATYGQALDVQPERLEGSAEAFQIAETSASQQRSCDSTALTFQELAVAFWRIC